MTFALAVELLAQNPPRDTGPDFGKASPFGLLVVVLLLIGTFLLVRSMNKHLRKLPESFDPERPEPDQAADEGTVGVDPDADPGTADGTKREPGG
ncbi:MAG TPA: hypothetical protein VHH12_05745 [Mycobacterium sp.]|nr:hypothetical protein [Mycobacterium sp.]